MNELLDRVRQEIERIDPSPDGYEGTVRRVRNRQRKRRLGAGTVGLALTVPLVMGMWGVLHPSQPPASPRVSDLGLEPGRIMLPDGSFLPEGVLLLQSSTGPQILRHGEARSHTLGFELALDFSRDGSKVLAESGNQLVADDVETGQETVLLHSPAGEMFGSFAEWSPGTDMVAYTVGAADPAAKSTLCIYDLQSSSTRCWPEVGRVYSFDWSPDGSRLVVAGPGSEPLRLVDVDNGRVSDLVAQEGTTPINRAVEARGWGEGVQLVDPIWSPSGRYLAALASLRGSDLAYVPVVFTPSGQPIAFGRPSSEFPYPMAWSPSQDVVAYMQGESPYRITEARVLDPVSGEDRGLVTSDGRDYPRLMDLVWSPSGRWLAVSLLTNRANANQSLRIVNVMDPERSWQSEVDTGGVSSILVAWRI